VPPVDGFRLQLMHLCRELAGRHEVCVLAGAVPEQAVEMPPGVELVPLERPSGSAGATAATTARAILTRTPRRAVTLLPAMRAGVDRVLAGRKFDVAHVAGPALAAVAPEFGGLPAVLSTLDAWHLNAAASANVAPAPLRPFYRLEERSVRRYGRRSYRAFDRVVVVSDADAEALRELDPGLAPEVIPNGVDSDELAPNPKMAREAALVVFTGAMSWAPNEEAALYLAERVLPLLRERRPDARVAIVGRRPGPRVRALGTLEGVEVTGEVPDMRPWLWRASAFACPMASGTGIKNKLLEALACGAPAVVTPLSCQGIDVRPGEELLVASDAEELADALARLLDDSDLAGRLARAGRRMVVENHSWSSVARSYEQIYEELSGADDRKRSAGPLGGPQQPAQQR